ncbi:MAG: hypothetical protein HRT73_05710 [Flavobacteriales bacterium]|nr:hypothetical protein [Flavobacteriales bacterium]
MQVQYLGCESIQGKKRGTGEAYGPFFKLYYLVPVEEINTENRKISGGGFSPQEVSISYEVFEKTKNIAGLALVEVHVGADPKNLNRTVVSSVREVKAA